MRYGGPSDGTAVASAAAATAAAVGVTVAAFTARSMLTRTSQRRKTCKPAFRVECHKFVTLHQYRIYI